MTEKRSMEHCLNYTGKPKCHYTGEICDDDFVQICEDYRSDEGTYPCPHCNRTGLKLLDYGSNKVWECMRCGAELWYCETVEEMKKRCREIKGDDGMTEKRFTLEETDWSYRIRDNGAVMKIPKIVDLLNEQHETIQQLKQEIETLQEQLAHFDIGDV